VPPGDQTRLQQSLAARAENVAPLRRAVVAYAAGHGASAPQREDIALAVSEALSNAVLHAYSDRAPGAMSVAASIGDRFLHVVVTDGGCGMRPRPDTGGLRLGLPLIGRVAERLELERRGDGSGVRVRMAFAIG
jgi:serine/threonine-protein kinase RsbW/stage II sporulation protein AB (anti-sigma F factor)